MTIVSAKATDNPENLKPSVEKEIKQKEAMKKRFEIGKILKSLAIHGNEKDGGCPFYHNPLRIETPSVRCDTSINHLKR